MIKTENNNYEELLQFLQTGKISFLRFIMEGENAQDYLDWCRTHGTDPSDESAEFYVEQTDIDRMERQLMDDEDYGIWD